jgi:hypothetical protein
MLKKNTMAILLAMALTASLTVAAFAAEEPALTRAELVSELYELDGEPEVNYAMSYTDVDAESEYAEAIRWATAEGIATGYGDGRFGPDDAVTREQMAVMLYRHAQSLDLGFKGCWAFPLGYEDAGEVSDYAYEAVCWMSMNEVMGADDDGLFHPDGVLTQDDAAAIIERYCAVADIG